MKKTALISILIATPIFLSGCLGISTNVSDNPPPEGFQEYKTNDFKIQIPQEWEVLTPLNFKSDTPANTIVAFRSNIKNPRFTPNIVILKNELSGEISTSDYAKALREKLGADLGNFRELIVEPANINISGKPAETLFIYIEGRNEIESDIKRFMQISAVKGQTAYVVMGSFLPYPQAESDAVATTIQTTVKSFELK